MRISSEKVLKAMKQASIEAGNLLNSYFGKEMDVQKKGKIDLVSSADIDAEQCIKRILKTSFPEISFITEEGGGTFTEDLIWLVDPLDGTTNFLHQIPFYATSIALYRHPEILFAAIYLPEFDELYLAEKGSGSYLNGVPIQVSDCKKLSESILATGFPYDVWTNYDDVLKSFKSFLLNARAIRRFGAAAIDLAYVANGIFDGYFELRLKPWDTAAGSLLVQEAGGKITNFKGKEYNPFMDSIIASNSRIHEEMILCLKSNR